MSRMALSEHKNARATAGPASNPSRLLQRKCSCGAPTASLTGKCPECQRRQPLQRKPAVELQRQEAPKEKTNEEKYQEGLAKMGEAFLQTPLGKALLEKIRQDTLVKGVTNLGQDFISTWPGKIVTGAAATGAVAALVATHKELPVQIPEIPLDALTPGLSVRLTYKGPVDQPTEAMITFKYTEQVPKSRSGQRPLSEAEKFRAETARLAAEAAKFRAGMTYPPGSQEDLQQKAEQEAIRKVVLKYSGGPDIEATIKKYPWLTNPRPDSGLQLTMPRLSRPALQKKLSIGASNDPLEQEADKVADQVMMTSANPVIRISPPHIQCQNKHSTNGSYTTPASVDRVLASPGRPLDPTLQKKMEHRFGHDFSAVRIHTGTAAEQSARDINASAYTAGQNIVFGENQYQPDSYHGQHLLSHELTHTIQQRDASTSVQRSCIASPCPPILVPIDALFPRYEAAEKCIQNLYATSHPAKSGISLSFNADWLNLTGGSRNQRMALGCLRGEETPGAGPNFTAKGLMYPAAPDMWDFHNQTMYEITTPSGSPFRINKLGAQISLANKLCGTADCGGLQFDRGTWSPPAGCFSLGGELYFTANNIRGVIIYNLFKDATKELAIATALAALAAALKMAGPKLGAAAVGKAIGGKIIPAYAVAGLAAAAILLVSGQAEAKIGIGGKDPLLSLFEELEKNGTKVPPEIKEMLDKNPSLKDKLNKAMAKGGDPTDVQMEINKQILEIIVANKEKFTADELDILLASTQVAGKALPKGDMTAEELKKLAATAKAGKPGSDSDGDKARPLPDSSKDNGDGSKGMNESNIQTNQDTASQLSQSMHKKLTEAPQQVRDLLKGLLGHSPNAKKMNDANVQRFLSMVPPGISAEQVTKILEQVTAVEGESIDKILDSLQAALENINDLVVPKQNSDAPADSNGKPGVSATTSPTPTPAHDEPIITGSNTSSSSKTSPEYLIKNLAAEAKKASFLNIPPEKYRITWKPAESGGPTVGSLISGNLRGKLKNGTTYVGHIEAKVVAANGRKLKIKFISSTPMVTADEKIIMNPDLFVDNTREDSFMLDPPKKKHRSK